MFVQRYLLLLIFSGKTCNTQKLAKAKGSKRLCNTIVTRMKVKQSGNKDQRSCHWVRLDYE